MAWTSNAGSSLISILPTRPQSMPLSNARAEIRIVIEERRRAKKQGVELSAMQKAGEKAQSEINETTSTTKTETRSKTKKHY